MCRHRLGLILSCQVPQVPLLKVLLHPLLDQAVHIEEPRAAEPVGPLLRAPALLSCTATTTTNINEVASCDQDPKQKHPPPTTHPRHSAEAPHAPVAPGRPIQSRHTCSVGLGWLLMLEWEAGDGGWSLCGVGTLLLRLDTWC